MKTEMKPEELLKFQKIKDMETVYNKVCQESFVFNGQRFFIYDNVSKMYLTHTTKNTRTITLTPIEFCFKDNWIFVVDGDDKIIVFDEDFQTNKIDRIFKLMYEELIIHRKGRSIYSLICSDRLSEKEIQMHTFQTKPANAKK